LEGVDGGITLKRMLKEWVGECWTKFICLSIGENCDFCEHDNEHSRSTKCRKSLVRLRNYWLIKINLLNGKPLLRIHRKLWKRKLYPVNRKRSDESVTVKTPFWCFCLKFRKMNT
jgi:hypothetical protein